MIADRTDIFADRVRAFVDGSSLAEDDVRNRLKSIAEEKDSGEEQSE
jgi:hypothetical protein